MIYFVRHGESVSNLKGVHDGQRLDSHLTEKGVQQAIDAANQAMADGLKFDRIIASPLKRTVATAQEFSKVFGVAYETDARIKEYDMGLASGMSIAETNNDYKTNNPEAEPVADFEARVADFLKSIQDSSENILIVGHGGVARIIQFSEMPVKPHNFIDIELAKNGKVYTLEEIKNFKG